MKSTFLSLDKKDLIKGFIMAILGALLAAVYQAIQENTIAWTWAYWQPIVFSSVGTGILYLLKNVFTNSEDKLLKKEP